ECSCDGQCERYPRHLESHSYTKRSSDPRSPRRQRSERLQRCKLARLTSATFPCTHAALTAPRQKRENVKASRIAILRTTGTSTTRDQRFLPRPSGSRVRKQT